jgi:hypothetical protein
MSAPTHDETARARQKRLSDLLAMRRHVMGGAKPKRSAVPTATPGKTAPNPPDFAQAFRERAARSLKGRG